MRRLLPGFVLFVGSALLVSACSDDVLGGGASSSNTANSPVASMDAIEQMEIAFIGGHSQAEIKAKIDRAMDLYDLAKTSENYSRAGSVLVALRKEYGPSEMAILDELRTSPRRAEISSRFFSSPPSVSIAKSEASANAAL